MTKLGFLKFSGLWFTKHPKRRISPTNLSQALCVPDRDLFNYSPYEGTSEHNVCYYAHPLGAGFHIVPPCTQVFQTVISPGSLEHGCQFDSGSWLGKWPPSSIGRHLIPACLGLETAGSQFPVQLPALRGGPSLVCSLGIEVERLEWGQRGGSGGRGKEKGAHLKAYFLSRLPLLSFSPCYQDVWCQTSSLIQLR